MWGYSKRVCECKQRVNHPQHQCPPNPCASRNQNRSFSPDCRNYKPSCPSRNECQTRCCSAPAQKRNDTTTNDWDYCNNKRNNQKNSRLEPLFGTPIVLQPVNRKAEQATRGAKKAKPTKSKSQEGVKNTPRTPKEANDGKKTPTAAKEHEYVYFLLKITEDILRNNAYEDEELEKLFKSHVDANKGHLDEERMWREIDHLKKELNFPLMKPTSLTNEQTLLCDCDPEKNNNNMEEIQEEPEGEEEPNRVVDQEEFEPVEEEKFKEEEPDEDENQDRCCKDEPCNRHECEKLVGSTKKRVPSNTLIPETKNYENELQNVEEQGDEDDGPSRNASHPSNTQIKTNSEMETLLEEPPNIRQESTSQTWVTKSRSATEKPKSETIVAKSKSTIEEPTSGTEIAKSESIVENQKSGTMVAKSRSSIEEPKSGTVMNKSRSSIEEPKSGTVMNKSRSSIEEPKSGTVMNKSRSSTEEPKSGTMIVKSKSNIEKPKSSLTVTKSKSVTDEPKSNTALPKNKSQIKSSNTLNDLPLGNSAAESLSDHNAHVKVTPLSDVVFLDMKNKEDSCSCISPLHKPALKIESKQKDEQYVMVEGPVCIPKSMLETMTTPVLVHRASSQLFEEEIQQEEEKEEDEASRVNLFYRKSTVTPKNNDNIAGSRIPDSVSVVLKNLNKEEMTPEKENDLEKKQHVRLSVDEDNKPQMCTSEACPTKLGIVTNDGSSKQLLVPPYLPTTFSPSSPPSDLGDFELGNKKYHYLLVEVATSTTDLESGSLTSSLPQKSDLLTEEAYETKQEEDQYIPRSASSNISPLNTKLSSQILAPPVPESLVYAPPVPEPLVYTPSAPEPLVYTPSAPEPLVYTPSAPEPLVYTPSAPEPLVYTPPRKESPIPQVIPPPGSHPPEDYSFSEEIASTGSNLTNRQPSSVLKQVSGSLTSANQKNVRYSVTEELMPPLHVQEEQPIKSTSQPMVAGESPGQRQDVALINARMKEFRNLESDHNINDRFQVNNPEDYEIRRVSTVGGDSDEEDGEVKKSSKCCGLGGKGKKKS